MRTASLEDKLTNEEFRIYQIIKHGTIYDTVSYSFVYEKEGEHLTSELNRILKRLVEKKLIKWNGREEYIKLSSYCEGR